jgi:hypothetical protein
MTRAENETKDEKCHRNQQLEIAGVLDKAPEILRACHVALNCLREIPRAIELNPAARLSRRGTAGTTLVRCPKMQVPRRARDLRDACILRRVKTWQPPFVDPDRGCSRSPSMYTATCEDRVKSNRLFRFLQTVASSIAQAPQNRRTHRPRAATTDSVQPHTRDLHVSRKPQCLWLLHSQRYRPISGSAAVRPAARPDKLAIDPPLTSRPVALASNPTIVLSQSMTTCSSSAAAGAERRPV